MGGSASVHAPLPDKYYHDYVKAMRPQTGRTFVITGTTTGTGFEAAKAIVSKGGKVICLNRPSERVSASLKAIEQVSADGGTATQIDCDLQDFASVRQAADAVARQTEPEGVFALVNNAGVMDLATKATKDGYDVQMQTNHLSHFLLTGLLMPSLEKGADSHGEARVVNHSSCMRNDPDAAGPLEAKYMQPFTDGVDLGNDTKAGRGKRYQQTKLANSVFTLALKEKLNAKGSKIKSLVAHPGISTTSLIANTSLQSPGARFDSKMKMRFFRNFMQGPGDGALPLLAATVAPEAESGDFYTPAHFGLVGKALGDTMKGPPIKMDWEKRGDKEKHTTDPAGQKLLWECSEAATGLSFAF